MRLAELARRYQGRRTNHQFAQLMGVDPSLLTRLYKGRLGDSPRIMRGLLRAFPESRDEVLALLTAPEDDRHAAV
jgi:hypothetical protein